MAGLTIDSGENARAWQEAIVAPAVDSMVGDRAKWVVKNSAWDGSVSQVKKWLRATVNDPDSLTFDEWSEVSFTGDSYAVRCSYRAKNLFGGVVRKNQIFYLDASGSVTGAMDWQ